MIYWLCLVSKQKATSKAKEQDKMRRDKASYRKTWESIPTGLIFISDKMGLSSPTPPAGTKVPLLSPHQAEVLSLAKRRMQKKAL